MKRQRSIAGPVLFSSLLSAGLGYWLGHRHVTPEAQPTPIVTMLECPALPGASPATHDATPPEPHHHAVVSIDRPQGNQLPALTDAGDHREQLLQFIRSRALTLEDCVPGGRDRLRLTLRLDVGGQGSIQRVQVMDGDATETQVGQCIASRMQTWTLPADLVQPRQSLIMSVVL